MTFKDYTSTNKVKEYFPDFIINRESFVPTNLPLIELEPYLKKQINFGLKSYKSNEAFADKFLIAPVLNYIWLKHENLNLWTQTYIEADTNLKGIPDYMLSPLCKKEYETLTLPIVVMVEAKQENFTLGWGQCLSEMIACQKLNKSADIKIFGIVSTGQVWEFGVLEKNVLIRDSRTFSLSKLEETISIVDYIFDSAEKEISLVDTSIILPDNSQVKDF